MRGYCRTVDFSSAPKIGILLFWGLYWAPFHEKATRLVPDDATHDAAVVTKTLFVVVFLFCWVFRVP